MTTLEGSPNPCLTNRSHSSTCPYVSLAAHNLGLLLGHAYAAGLMGPHLMYGLLDRLTERWVGHAGCTHV